MKNIRFLKADFFALNNKAGAFLARCFKGKQNPFLTDMTSGAKVSSPDCIAKIFKEYYASLYDLKADTQTSKLALDQIFSFLHPLSLPRLTDTQFSTLSSPFTELEMEKVIYILLKSKAPGIHGFPNIIKNTMTHWIPIYLHSKVEKRQKSILI